MNYRLMFTINAIVAAAIGALLLAVSKSMLILFGITDATTATVVVTRFFGGSLVAAGVLIWFLKDVKDMQRNTAITLLAASVVGFILTLLGMVSDKVIRSNGWVLLVIYFLFALGYAYLIFGVSVSVKKKKR
jgi:hypothetical protein